MGSWNLPKTSISVRANKDKPRHKRGEGKNSKTMVGKGGAPLLMVHPLIQDLVVERLQFEAYIKANREATAMGHVVNPSLDLPTSHSLAAQIEKLERTSQDQSADSAIPLDTSVERADFVPLSTNSSDASGDNP